MSVKTPDSESPFFNSAQLAAYLKISDDAVYKLRATGKGPAFSQPVARRYLYRKVDVDKWLAEQRQHIVPPKPRRRRRRANNRVSELPRV